MDKDTVQERVKAAFGSKWDTDGTGLVNEERFRNLLNSLGLTDADIQPILSNVEKAADGRIDYKTFLNFLYKPAHQTVIADNILPVKPDPGEAAWRKSKTLLEGHHHLCGHDEQEHHGGLHSIAEVAELKVKLAHLEKLTEKWEPRVKNDAEIRKPEKPTFVDNTLLFLPDLAVRALKIEPNMDDKGEGKKKMWFGRVWELRELMKVRHREKLTKVKEKELAPEVKKELNDRVQNDPTLLVKVRKLAARWRGAITRKSCNFEVLEKLKYSYVLGTLIYAHGSGGCSWDNMRICRMICRLGFLVIAPDGFAHPPDSGMGQLRRKELQPLTKATEDTDYWAGDLIYASSAQGIATYSTAADNVLTSPDDYRALYERCYQLRRSELHFVISRLPLYIKTRGFFLGGTSEGAMTITRFDDQRYGKMVLGRFINSFSIEYCYFTPVPEAAEIGGQLDVPTLNIIGTKDEFFAAQDSVAQIVAEDKLHGYGDTALTGHGYNTMVRQNMKCGLVTLLTNGVHSPCNTHDNFLRQLFETFFTRPACINQIDEIWKSDHTRAHLINVQQSSVHNDDIRANILQILVPAMRQPQQLSLKEVDAGRLVRAQGEAMQKKFEEEQQQAEAQSMMNQIMLDTFRAQSKQGGGEGFKNVESVESYYSDKAKA